MRRLERYFDLYQNDTTLSQVVLAGVTTFITMANCPQRRLSFRINLFSLERATRSRMDRKRHSQSIENCNIDGDRHVTPHYYHKQCKNRRC